MGRARRRAVSGLLAAGLVSAGLAGCSSSSAVSTGPAGVSPAGPASGPPTASSRTPPSPSAPATAATPSAAPVSPGSAGSTDPGGRGPGIRLVAGVLTGGVFEVTETVRLPAPVTRLTLAPPDLGAAGRGLRGARAVATDVAVRAGDRPVRVPGRTVRRPTTVPVGRAADRFEIRYRLSGAVRASRPSRSGRALGAVAPLVSNVPATLPVAVSFRGEAMRNLGCARLPTDQEACIAGRRPNVRVDRDLAYRDALVVVQLDLPAASPAGRR